MSDCPQELCRNWTGQGCACEVMGIEPDVVDDDESAHAPGEYCIEWVGVDLAPDGPDKVYACVECGRTHRQGDMP